MKKKQKYDSKEIGALPILAAIDFSNSSRRALLFAADLADRINHPLHVLHIIHDPGNEPGYYSIKKKQVLRIEERAAEMFELFMADIRSANPEQKSLQNFTYSLVSGIPVTRILEIEKKIKPFMLVLGSQGRTGLSHLMLGSKAEQIVQLSKYPVTIVK